MTDYGPNFGFRRSAEEFTLREGRLKLPGTGTYHQGDLVKRDIANDGYLTVAANTETAKPGVTGLLIQEEGWDYSIYGESEVGDTYTRGGVRLNKMAQLVSGSGVKFWLRNNAAVTNPDRTIAARTVVTVTSLAIGDYLGWDGTKWVENATAAQQHAVVTKVSGSGATGYVEAVLLY